MKDQIVICNPKRTPIGSFQGSLSSLSAVELGISCVKSVLQESKLSRVDELIAGCVLQAGTKQAPARQLVKGVGLPDTTQAMTINKVCSSGLRAVQLAVQSILAGSSEIVIAGGMESMSQAPYILRGMRSGVRLGHSEAQDVILVDGLLDAFDGSHMGLCAEACAAKYEFSREVQDAYAINSYKKAQNANFEGEISPVEIKGKKGSEFIKADEEPTRVNFEKIPELRPAFDKSGTVTAANASSINDGASFMIVTTESVAKREGLTPLARVLSIGWFGQEPKWFTTAPVGAVEMALGKAGLKIEDIDLVEINEAFSVVALACQKELRIPDEKLNINGGAVALGHPIGASGARILTTLIHSLKRTGKKKGVAGICNGGGEATSIVVETI
jgi:acetyl-CoA C-acetyltransferase